MKKVKEILFSLFFLIIFLPLGFTLAKELLIVEVQIGPQDNDLVKIYNLTEKEIDISGFKLRKRSSTGKEYSLRVFPQGSKILAKGFFVWANSKENFHLKAGANVWSRATLAKDNSVALLDKNNAIIDAVAWGESKNPFVLGEPFPENPKDFQKLKRKKTKNTYQNTRNNSQDFYLEKVTEETKPKHNLISDIYFNEILPNTPVGQRDKEKEYIELFNENDFEVDLEGWQIKDGVGKTKVFVFPKETKIRPKGFLVLFRPQTKIVMNNQEDKLFLLNPKGEIVDKVSYQKAPRGKSYNKTQTDWVWSPILTPGSKNVLPSQKPPSPKKELALASLSHLPPQKETIKNLEEKREANLSLYVLVGAWSIFAGILILILKRSLESGKNNFLL